MVLHIVTTFSTCRTVEVRGTGMSLDGMRIVIRPLSTSKYH